MFDFDMVGHLMMAFFVVHNTSLTPLHFEVMSSSYLLLP